MLEWKKNQLKRQLQESRFRLYHMYKEFAEPLYEMLFVATKDVWRMSTNGACIYFDPEWLQKLASKELDFILSHQLMHLALGHIERPDYYRGDRYHLAADIVANGKLTVLGWRYEKIPHIGKVRMETFFPSLSGETITSIEAIKCIPIDPSVMKPAQRRQFMIDSEEWWGKKEDRGEDGTIVLCPQDEDPEDLKYEGPSYGGTYRFQKEYFPKVLELDGEPGKSEKNENTSSESISKHRIMHTLYLLRQEEKTPEIGSEAGYFERPWNRRKVPAVNWRNILDQFVQEEINDYSFLPPDRRMQVGEFFLPEYNVKNETVKDVLFMVDTSGSVRDEMLAVAFDEIRQALDQFQGALSGTVGFFDTRVHSAVAFESVEDIKKLKPTGGGGTDYNCIFHFINESHWNSSPTSIVIITDGEGEYPAETEAGNIPVLWLMTGEKTAPWGRSIGIG